MMLPSRSRHRPAAVPSPHQPASRAAPSVAAAPAAVTPPPPTVHDEYAAPTTADRTALPNHNGHESLSSRPRDNSTYLSGLTTSLALSLARRWKPLIRGRPFRPLREATAFHNDRRAPAANVTTERQEDSAVSSTAHEFRRATRPYTPCESPGTFDDVRRPTRSSSVN